MQFLQLNIQKFYSEYIYSCNNKIEMMNSKGNMVRISRYMKKILELT